MSFDWSNWRSYVPTVSFPGEGFNRTIKLGTLASGLEAKVAAPEPVKSVTRNEPKSAPVPSGQSSAPVKTRTDGYDLEDAATGKNGAIVDTPAKPRLENAFYMLALAPAKNAAPDADMNIVLINNCGAYGEIPRIVSMPRSVYNGIKDELPKGWQEDALFDTAGIDLGKYGKHVRAYSPGMLNMKTGREPGNYDWLEGQDSMDFKGRKRIPAKDVNKPVKK